MHRVLRAGGMLTIVTDNRLYAHALAKIVHGLNTTTTRDGGGAFFSCRFSGDDDDEDVVTAVAAAAAAAVPPAATAAMGSAGKLQPTQNHRRVVGQMDSSDSDSESSHSDDEDGDFEYAGRLSHTPAPATRHKDGGADTAAAPCAIRVHPGGAGERGGHYEVEENSSYFSRMWKHGNKARVWHLILTKVSTKK
jgi:hypothetical protein